MIGLFADHHITCPIGCIRMWDPTMAAQNPKNGKVLAEVNSDIGHFSLGDPYAGENQLMV